MSIGALSAINSYVSYVLTFTNVRGSEFCKKVRNTAGPTNIVNAPTIDRGVL